MTVTLTQYFEIHRRYHRSVNLERDLHRADAVEGYVLTERSAATLARILPAFSRAKANRAWTLTGVYGTGKSAFVHYLTSLCAGHKNKAYQVAVEIAHYFLPENSPELEAITKLPNKGFLNAVATGEQEPLTWTLARALARGANAFLPNKLKGSELVRQLNEWESEIQESSASITPQEILNALQELAEYAKTHILLIVDELGKNLEYAARHQGQEDLYLLQQIAELELKGEHQVYFIGLLHQSFGGYSDRLSVTEQNEWNKIQGRFEDIPFSESPNQMTRLIGQVIDRTKAKPIEAFVNNFAGEWYKALGKTVSEQEITAELLANVYPLHPLTAMVLPILCTRYAQNDRSLFTFLTSDEPNSFKDFLEETEIENQILPTLKLHQLYDYFVETVTGLASRLNLQRWVEIQGLIEDAKDRSPETIKLLKTIGVLNLVTATGKLRATSDLAAWALCDLPDLEEKKFWLKAIEGLKHKGLITHRKQLDELRIWQGSDFNVEGAITELVDQQRTALTQLLAEVSPLKPLVAQRHYNQTGTLRYFEQRYGDGTTAWEKLTCSDPSFDGLILYWLDVEPLENIPETTAEGKPLIIIKIHDFEVLQKRGREYRALKTIYKKEPKLQTDGVARREVLHRLTEAGRILDEAIAQALSWSQGQNSCWIRGKKVEIQRVRTFQSKLSDLCDEIYHQRIQLDNELINRRELTSQGVKARRELITAMIEKGDRPRLDFEGYGPEVAMYASVLENSGIHQPIDDDHWEFVAPRENSGLETVWQVIEEFCNQSTEKARSLDQLYVLLEQPPYGVKQGVVPVLLAAVLLRHMDDVGVYQDGTFIPVLGVEHFELLIRYPERFAVKSFAIAGLRSEVFKELESVLKSPNAKTSGDVRNSTLLTVVTPLYQFVKKLPRYTKQTKRISDEGIAVLKILQQTVEPDELLFRDLPQALGLEPITTKRSEKQLNNAKELKGRLVQVLREIYGAYDALLTESRQLIFKAFGVRSEEAKLKEDLQVRCRYLVNQCIEPTLKRFMKAVLDSEVSDRQWLESLVMIIADKPAESWTDQGLFFDHNVILYANN
ncbi:hypothetical protein [Picosynechococcus sp. NKBG042902]|uniref:hypothetical protein n=1 Tax=Picosynechococcus sp. NKBG042902 TaxID=490193 RepID=UPI0006950C09|nr:hypothetical protein [Picosynechococcus sp. NKBG042902]